MSGEDVRILDMIANWLETQSSDGKNWWELGKPSFVAYKKLAVVFRSKQCRLLLGHIIS